ncbi:UNVERIFIED_CONTAM: hypothetical protein K2H54_029914 [Gekko kuhli]
MQVGKGTESLEAVQGSSVLVERDEKYGHVFSQAVLHSEQQLLVRFWYLWRRRTVAHIEEQEEETLAQEHYCHQILQATFHLWKENVQEMKEGRKKEEKALRFHSIKLLHGSWCKWQQYLRHQSKKWKKLVKADVQYQRVLLHKILSAWKAYQTNVQHILYDVDEKEKKHNQELLRQVLHAWRGKVAYLKDKAKKAVLAEQHFRRTILSKLLKRQGDQLMAQRLYSTCFSMWKIQVFDAWIGSVLERRRKKARIEKAVEVYRADLLREGVTRILRYAAGMKQFRGKLQAQHQLKMASHYHHLVYRCAMLWKQKALCQKRGLSLPGAPLKKRVSFKVPVPDAASKAGGGSGEASSLCSGLRPAQSEEDLRLCLAAGDSILTELHSARQRRLQPRRPDFLLQSLERMEMPGSNWNGLEALSGPLQKNALSKPYPLAGASLPSTLKEQSGHLASSHLGTSSCSSPSFLKSALPHSTACQKLELLPPSSFVPRLRNGEKTGEKSLSFHSKCYATSPPVAGPWKERVATGQKEDLFLPADFVRSKSPSSLYGRTGQQESQMDSSAREAEVHKQLEAELRQIGQKMQCYYRNQQELKCVVTYPFLICTWGSALDIITVGIHFIGILFGLLP